MIPERIVGTVGDYLLIEKRSYLGYPYVVWEKPMPRTNDTLLRVVVYLYPSEQGAVDAMKAGGTGFIVRLQTDVTWYDYAITNRHNITEYDARFVRLNTHDRKKPIEIFEGDWECSTTDDIAACELPFHRAHYDYQPISVEHLITKETARDLSIGPGDDLFMAGRFINFDGKVRNTPVLRFGTIAMMPEEPIIVDGQPQESFLIEIRTIPGFSGSPVFIHMPAEARAKDRRFSPNAKDKALLKQYGYLEKCLGIEWCRVKGETVATPMFNGSTFDIQVTTGMSGCIPAWKILEFLQINEKLVIKRKENERQILAKEKQQVVEYTGARRLSQQTTPREGKPIEISIPSQEQFSRDLDKAIRRKKKRS
jgi:hypothetical protein